MECLDKSPIINVGQTFVTKFGNIRLIKVYDSGSGQIGIKPSGWTNEVIFTTVDWRVEPCGPVTVKTNFFTLAGRGAHFWVCGEAEEEPARCDQIFKLQDQNGNSLDGNVQIGTTALTVIGTGTISLEEGVPIIAVASYGDLPYQTKNIVPCEGVIVFTFEIPEPPIPEPPIPEPPEDDDNTLLLIALGIVVLAALFAFGRK